MAARRAVRGRRVSGEPARGQRAGRAAPAPQAKAANAPKGNHKEEHGAWELVPSYRTAPDVLMAAGPAVVGPRDVRKKFERELAKKAHKLLKPVGATWLATKKNAAKPVNAEHDDEMERLHEALATIERRHREIDEEAAKMDGGVADISTAKALKIEKLRLKDRAAMLRSAAAKLETGRSSTTLLGEGSYGRVLLGRPVSAASRPNPGNENNGRPVSASANAAVKIARAGAEAGAALQTEAEVLTKLSGAPGFPRLLWFGRQEVLDQGECDVLVMDLLGPSMEALSWACRGGAPFSFSTALWVAAEALQGLSAMHARGLAHGDVKPANLLMEAGGRARRRALSLADFGSAYQFAKGGAPRPSRGRGEGFTVKFASAGELMGAPPTPADDIESLAYTLLDMAGGGSPFPLELVSAAENGNTTALAELAKLKPEVPLSAYFSDATMEGGYGERGEQPVAQAAELMLAEAHRCAPIGFAGSAPNYAKILRAIEKALSEESGCSVDTAASSRRAGGPLAWRACPAALDWEAAGVDWTCEGELLVPGTAPRQAGAAAEPAAASAAEPVGR